MAHYARLSEIGDTLDAIIDDGAQFNAAYLIDERTGKSVPAASPVTARQAG